MYLLWRMALKWNIVYAVYTNTYTYTCTYVYVYVYMYMYTYMYLYKYIAGDPNAKCQILKSWLLGLVVNGDWGAWASWSGCSRTCGGGYRSRTQECNSPLPANRGTYCSGSSSDTQSCNTAICVGKNTVVLRWCSKQYRCLYWLPWTVIFGSFIGLKFTRSQKAGCLIGS